MVFKEGGLDSGVQRGRSGQWCLKREVWTVLFKEGGLVSVFKEGGLVSVFKEGGLVSVFKEGGLVSGV